MNLPALAAVLLGILGQGITGYFFLIRPESPQMLPFIALFSLCSAIEAAGVLLLVRTRRG